jgi:Zn-dependent M16 (insulinase) family peptidase
MKGAMSDPDGVLWREIPSALYPDTTYSVESGGDPDEIVNLTYEQFLEFHSTYYHPSNSYIYLYGDMDMAEKLTFIDEQYLSAFEPITVSSEVASQETFEQEVRVVKSFPISEGEDVDDNTYLSYNVCVGDSLDRDLYVAMKILDFALCTVPGAPLKQALLDAGIGKDVFSVYDNGLKQPFFGIVAKGTSISKEETFKKVIRDTLAKIVRDGFEEKSILSAISHFEFIHREADYGSRPKGLFVGLQMLDSWLYDDQKPFIHVEANDTYERLKNLAKEGYFEALIRDYLLENPHAATVILVPEEGLAAKKEAALKDKLDAIHSQMSEEEIAQVRSMQAALDAFREAEDSPEDLAKIPLLTREDLKREAAPFYNNEVMVSDTLALHHDLFTNGIGYLRLIFSLDKVPYRLLPYIGLMKNLFRNLNTANYSYGALSNEINLVTGGVSVVQNNYSNVQDTSKSHITMEVCTRALYENLDRAMELISEMLFTSDFTDEKRIKEILAEGNSKSREMMTGAGHVLAVGRALSYLNAKDAIEEELSGLDQYRFTCDLESNFEERKAELIASLKELCKYVFRPENLMIDFTGSKEALLSLECAVDKLKKNLCTEPVEFEPYEVECTKKNEGLTTSGQVLYVCRAGNFLKKGLPYKGTLNVLRVMLGYEYLWVNVRVKGGAYGCMCGFYRDGGSYFVSYRDPNLAQTIDVYENAAKFIEEYDANERTMTQYIIGAISEMDTPLSASAKGRRSRELYFNGLTQEMLQKTRDEVLDATPEDIRETAAYIRAFMDDESLCVVGNEKRIREEADRFGAIENLF